MTLRGGGCAGDDEHQEIEMTEWSLQHPYMTFVCFMWAVTCFAGSLSRLADALKRPQQPATTNINMPAEAFFSQVGNDRDDLN